MVNKAFLSLAAVVLFAVFGTGVFVGMQVGGLGDEAPGQATESGPQATGTATPADAPETDTPAPEPTATTAPSEDDPDTSGERESVPPREFNERNIRTTVVDRVNDAREDEGLERLSTTGSTAETLREMAGSHSDAMADAGLVRHTIDGVSSADRYRQYNLYDTCQFQVESYIENAENDDLEVVGRTYAGQYYPDNGTQAFNANDTAVATALTEDWLSTPVFRDRLLIPNAGRIGVDVTITRNGAVYATVNVCS